MTVPSTLAPAPPAPPPPAPVTSTTMLVTPAGTVQEPSAVAWSIVTVLVANCAKAAVEKLNENRTPKMETIKAFLRNVIVLVIFIIIGGKLIMSFRKRPDLT
jgi:3-oxoacyl-ACP reductase-like protein